MKFGYVIVYVEDVAAALAFYGKAFGLATRFLHESGGYGELETGGTALAFAAHAVAEGNLSGGYARLAEQPRPSGMEAGFVTEDVAAAFARACAAGATPLSEPKVKPWGQTVAYVRCPFGVLVELCTPMG